jgi:hypothetical protein
MVVLEVVAQKTEMQTRKRQDQEQQDMDIVAALELPVIVEVLEVVAAAALVE